MQATTNRVINGNQSKSSSKPKAFDGKNGGKINTFGVRKSHFYD